MRKTEVILKEVVVKNNIFIYMLKNSQFIIIVFRVYQQL